MSTCSSVLMWCLTSPVFPNSLVVDVNIVCLFVKKFTKLVLSVLDKLIGKCLLKSTSLGDNSSWVQELTLIFSVVCALYLKSFNNLVFW